MKQLVTYLIVFVCFISQRVHAQGEELPPPNAIPIQYTKIPPHLLATQFNFSAGTGRIGHGDKQLLSGSAEVKGLYNLSGAIYLSSGLGYTALHSRTEPSPDRSGIITRNADLVYVPSGIGFSIGDDRATIITGIDFLPGFYLNNPAGISNTRTFAIGYGPEFGFLFKAGPHYHKGILIGMVGKVQFMQRPDREERALKYSYAGVGLVIRFY